MRGHVCAWAGNNEDNLPVVHPPQAATRMLYNISRAGDVARRTIKISGGVQSLLKIISTDRCARGRSNHRMCLVGLTHAEMLVQLAGPASTSVAGNPLLSAVLRSSGAITCP